MGGAFSTEWGEGFIQKPVEYVLKHAEPGDLILFSGIGGWSDLIRITSIAQNWSHVGVVVRIDENLAITEAYRHIIGEDVILGGRHTGVQTTNLETRLRTYEGHKVAWRPLRKRKEGEKKVKKKDDVPEDLQLAFINRMKAYPRDKIPFYCETMEDFIQYGVRMDDDNNVTKDGREFYVCTSWAASVLQGFGIFEKYYLDTEKMEQKKLKPSWLLLADIGLECFYGPLEKGWFAWKIHFITQT